MKSLIDSPSQALKISKFSPFSPHPSIPHYRSPLTFTPSSKLLPQPYQFVFRMKRPAPYAEDSPNRYAASQMQQMSGHRMQQHSRMNNYSGRPGEQGQPRTSSRGEDPRQWDSSAPSELNSVLSHLYSQGQGGNVAQSFPDGRVADRNPDSEKQVNSDPRLQSYEQDMEIGYDDKPPPLSFEGLEKKFQDEILKLVKELSDSEDVENARHREKIVEINNQYQERLSLLRAEQAKRREELLRKESLERLHLYQQSGIVNHPSEKILNDPRLHQQSGADNHPTERIPSDPRGYQQAGMGNHPHERDPRGYQRAVMGTHPSDPRGYQHADMDNDPTGRIPSDPRAYQQAGMGGGSHPNQRASTDPRSYGQRGYGGGQNESYREQSQYHGERSDRTEGRVPYPQGRSYNNASERYH